MRVLFLDPQPFYEDRGSPIAVKMVIELLSKRGDAVDLVTYHVGEDTAFSNINHMRTPNVPFIRTVRPGFSWQKLVCDVLMFLMTIRLVLTRRYDVIYAVEESVFFAVLFKSLFKIPYVYDMDSSLVEQMLDKYPALKSVNGMLQTFEGVAIRNAVAAVVVCDALLETARTHGAAHTVVLYDSADLPGGEVTPCMDLRSTFGIEGPIALYAGNLEYYQGLPLLFEGFATVLGETNDLDLVIVGGEPADIEQLRELAKKLGIDHKVHFTGRVAYKDLLGLLQQADILCSPRIKGTNTPMKIYSYLHSGKAIIATDLWTHRQVLDNTCARLVKAEPAAFADALLELVSDVDKRQQLGIAGRQLLDARYSYEAFSRTFNEFMIWLDRKVVVNAAAPEPLEIETAP